MAVSSILIFSPFDGFATSGLRPQTSIEWTGGTGPFDVLYEWDTVDTFDSGNLITDSNIGVTSPDEGTPPSDMGPAGTAWFLRVSVSDNDDDKDEIQTVSMDGNPIFDVTASHDWGANPIANIWDGDTGTNWLSGVGQSSAVIQIDIDAGVAVTIDGIRVFDNNCASIVLYWSDNGSSYTSIGTYNSLPSGSGWEDLTFSAITHRYWRIEDNGVVGDWWTIDEIELMGETPTAGTFILDYDGDTTSALDWDISLAAMETAIEGLTGITDVTVTGTVSENYIIEFNDPGETDVVLIVVDDNSLTPSATAIVVNETLKGGLGTPVIEPSSGGNEITFLDPIDNTRFLYLDHNIGPNFIDGVDGDPTEFSRYLYLHHNIGVAFGASEADGDPKDFSRFLYLNHNIDTTVPVPWIRIITPVILSQGDGLAIYGQGFDNVARDWSAEARLYNTPELDDTFVALSETGFVAGTGSDEDVLTVTVPGGASSGWVVVMNDNGL